MDLNNLLSNDICHQRYMLSTDICSTFGNHSRNKINKFKPSFIRLSNIPHHHARMIFVLIDAF